MWRLGPTILLWSVVASPAAAAPVYLDNFEQFTVGTDLTNITYTPAIGGTDSANLHPHLGTSTLPHVTAVSAFGGIAAEFNLPTGSGEDYLGRFLTTFTNVPLVFDWDITALDTNEGLGGFFIRFPTPDLDMQVLMGLLDDGRVIVFSGQPSAETVMEIGTYEAGVTYHARLALNLMSDSYSVCAAVESTRRSARLLRGRPFRGSALRLSGARRFLAAGVCIL